MSVKTRIKNRKMPDMAWLVVAALAEGHVARMSGWTDANPSFLDLRSPLSETTTDNR
jgi:hypothetical protein